MAKTKECKHVWKYINMKKINKNTDEYQRGYQEGFNAGVKKGIQQTTELFRKVNEQELPSGIEEKEHQSKEQKEDEL